MEIFPKYHDNQSVTCNKQTKDKDKISTIMEVSSNNRNTEVPGNIKQNLKKEFQMDDDVNKKNDNIQVMMEVSCKNPDVQVPVNIEQNFEKNILPIMELSHKYQDIQSPTYNKKVKKHSQIEDKDVNEQHNKIRRSMETSWKSHDIEVPIEIEQIIEKEWQIQEDDKHVKKDEIFQTIQSNEPIMEISKYHDNQALIGNKEKVRKRSQVGDENMNEQHDKTQTIMESSCHDIEVPIIEIPHTYDDNQALLCIDTNDKIESQVEDKDINEQHDKIRIIMEISCKSRDMQVPVKIEQYVKKEWETEDNKYEKTDKIVESSQDIQPIMKIPHKCHDIQHPTCNKHEVTEKSQTEDKNINEQHDNQSITEILHKYHDNQPLTCDEQKVKEECQISENNQNEGHLKINMKNYENQSDEKLSLNIEHHLKDEIITKVKEHNKKLLDENAKLQEQIRCLQEKLQLAGITSISEPTSPEVQESSDKFKKAPEKILSLDNQSSVTNSYGKRRGTVDFGKEYEYLLAGYYALEFSTNDKVLEFEMTSNDETYGDFDDLVITVKFVDGTTHTFIMQLKHSENKKNITERILTAEKGDFSLWKYFKSFQKLGTYDNITCILFTNRCASVRDDSELLLGSQEIGVKEAKTLPAEAILNTNRSRKCSVFQFEVLEIDKESQELIKFFNRFYLLSNQSNCVKLKMSLNETLKTLLQCEIYDNFVHFMKCWWSTNFVLNKGIVIGKLAELALSPSIITITCEKSNEKTKLLEEAIKKFDLTIVKEFCDEIVGKIWQIDEQDIQQAGLVAFNYGLATKRSNICQLSDEQRSKVLWYLNKVPLVVRVEDSKREQIFCAIKLLQKLPQKKKLLLFGNVSKEEVPEWNTFESLADLFNEKIYMDVLQNFQISLQGRESITLDKLIGSDTEITKVIGTRELFLMVQTPLIVGTKNEELPHSYISRTVTTVFLDTEKVLNNCDHANDLLIINCDEKFKKVFHFKDLEVMELYNYLQQIESCTNRHLIVLSTKSKCTKYQFDRICEETIKRHIYLLQIVDEKCCILVLSKDNPLHLKEMEYVRPPIEEQEIHKIFDNPINILCAQPGMGKSTLTTYLKNNCPSNFWSIRVNLKEYNSFLRKRPSREEILQKFLRLKSKQDSFIDQIKWAFLKNKKIYLFLDGLDEIESASVDFILDYIQYISSMGVHVWVCSRQNLQEVIVNELNIFSIDIKELNHRQQRKYIRQRLSCNYQEKEIQKITRDIFSNVDAAKSQNLLGVPLKLFIITENFLDNKAMYETRNHQMFVLTTMYRIFFEGKKKHHYLKVGLLDEHQLGYNFFNLVLEQYEIPALRSCLDNDAFNKLNLDMTKAVEFLETVKAEGDKFGIINQIHDDEKAVFNHQTYAEYFACVWFKKNLDKVQLLQDVFFRKEYQNLKFMFDIMLAEQCPLHLAVIYRNFDQVRNYLDCAFDKDEGGRNPLQLICSYGTKQQPLNSDHHYQQRLNSNDREDCNYQKIIKAVSRFDPLEIDEVFGWNSLDYSVASQCLYPIETILETHGCTLKLDTLFNGYNDVTLAYYSSKLGYQNLLKALLTRDPYVDNIRIGFEKISLLHIAVKGCNFNTNNDNVNIIKILIDHGVDINVRDEIGRTALHWAAEEGHYNMIKILLEEGADVNIITNNEETILHYATKSWKQFSLETIELLANSGVNINAKDKFGITALHLASEKEYYTMVEQLLAKGAEVNATTHQGETILHYAVRAREPNTKVQLLRHTSMEMLDRDEPKSSRQEDLVSLLLKSGANINATTKDEETILHYAVKAWKPSMKVIKLLVQNGVNINAKNKQGITALHRAFQKGHYGVVKVLLEHGADVNAVTNDKETILHYAARTLRPNTEIIELLVRRGVDINAKDKEGTSVLHWASEEGHYEIVKVLVENGADVNAITCRESTVLHYAATAWKPNRDVMKLLATSGVDVSKQDKNGVSALHWVSDIGYYDVTKVLLDRGANVNAITNKAETALHFATKAKDPNLEVIELLVSRGVDINTQDKDGITALHWAAERSHYDIVKLLVRSGANVNALTNTKQTVLNYAVRSRDANTAVIKLLVNSDVDVNSKDKDGISDLHWVAEIGHFDVVKLLLSKGADVNAVTNKQETVLHYAAIAREANTDVIALFMKSGVDADAKDTEGKTALHFAVERGLFENVKALVENGASVNAVTCNNLTALHFAVYRGRVEMVKLLIDGGLNLDNIDVYNETIPLYFVFKNGYLHVDWLLKMTEAIYNKFQLCCSYHEIVKFLSEEFQVQIEIPDNTPSTSRSNSQNNSSSFDAIYHSFVSNFFSTILCKRRQSLKNTEEVTPTLQESSTCTEKS